MRVPPDPEATGIAVTAFAGYTRINVRHMKTKEDVEVDEGLCSSRTR
jgi:hypothetical protein